MSGFGRPGFKPVRVPESSSPVTPCLCGEVLGRVVGETKLANPGYEYKEIIPASLPQASPQPASRAQRVLLLTFALADC